MDAENSIQELSSDALSSDHKKNSQDISVIIPVLNESDGLADLDQHLGLFFFGEVIYVDGGSTDGSWEWLQKNVDCVIQSDAGRAIQMNAGAKKASKDYLLFLHADTRLPEQASRQILKGLDVHSWGWFDVNFFGNDWLLSIVARCMNLRSRLTGVSTGDQGLFLERSVFFDIDGFDEIPLMEDVAITKRLKNLSRPFCSKARIITSSRRWHENGRLKTILLMWRLRWKYYRGESPETLRRYYQDVR